MVGAPRALTSALSVVLLAVGTCCVASPLRASAQARPVIVSSRPETFAGAARAARAAVVTLRLPGLPGAIDMPVDDRSGADDADEIDVPGADAPDEVARLGAPALGVAVIVDPSGLALTTARLARLAPALEAFMPDGRRVDTMLVGVDDETDVGMLRLLDAAPSFPSITLGDSGRVRVGDWVIAVGAPYGLAGSVTAGIVSATPDVTDATPLGAVMQLGAVLSVGHAGAPLVNPAGEVVGLVTGRVHGIGFAVPSNTARKVAVALLEHGRVRRGWLGVAGQALTADLARALHAGGGRGVVIVDVVPEGPAALAGLRPGDIVRELEGARVDWPAQLRRLVAGVAPDRTVTLRLWRAGRDRTVVVTVRDEPDEEASDSVQSRARRMLGAEVQPITSDMGVIVAHVERGGRADQAGIERADVIREVNGHRVRSLPDLGRALGADESGELVVLLQRGGESFYISLEAVTPARPP